MNSQQREALLEQLFTAARDLSPSEQEVVIAERCTDDALRSEVRNLLAAHRQAPKNLFGY